MRQPVSLSKALPRLDHHVYGPSISPWNRRPTSTQPSPVPVDPSTPVTCSPAAPRKRSKYARSRGRKPAFFTLPRQFRMSNSRCPTFRSPMITASGACVSSSGSRSSIASRKTHFASWRGVSTSPEGT